MRYSSVREIVNDTPRKFHGKVGKVCRDHSVTITHSRRNLWNAGSNCSYMEDKNQQIAAVIISANASALRLVCVRRSDLGCYASLHTKTFNLKF